MKTHLSRGLTRREFLKLISLTPVSLFARPLANLAAARDGEKPNVIIIVFDAWSRHNVSLYGYPRPTMPNLEKFAAKRTVYHNHFSPATFTVPGTSSLLTGLHPWSHRAFQLGAGIASEHTEHNIFAALSSTHSTLGYAQNKYADQILYQSGGHLETHVGLGSLNIQDYPLYSAPIFAKDARFAFASIEDNLIQKGLGYDASLFLGPLYRLVYLRNRKKYTDRYGADYPRGLPDTTDLFLLGDVVGGAIEILKGIETPTLAYLHFHPPHDPYNPSAEFFGKFIKGWRPPEMPVHPLSAEKKGKGELRSQRRFYDEYIASWDNEVGRLFQFLEDSGLTDNSYIFVTSDHGEIFERGELGHWSPLLFDPLVHVPLIVSRPGQNGREDIHTLTSSVDILPTVTHLTGNPTPDWAEGELLPGLGGREEAGRGVFSMDAKTNSSFRPLTKFSVSLTRGPYRLACYDYPVSGYKAYEFYDLNADPLEMNDLYPLRPSEAVRMQQELTQKIEEVNKPYSH